jgi:ribosomal protein L29
MKSKQFQEIKVKPKLELEKEVRDFRERLWVLKNDLAAGKVKNVKEINSVKKSIAQVLTVINNKKNF